MPLQDFLTTLGPAIEDPEEETFLLFAQDLPSQNLGFVDSKAPSLDLTIAGRDFTVHQSPSLLSSNRSAGTTGAVLWKVTPLIAEWLSCDNNVLRQTSILTPSSTVVEVGCGVNGLIALSVAPSIAHYIATDQEYVLKVLRQNIDDNTVSEPRGKVKPAGRRKAGGSGKAANGALQPARNSSNIHLTTLDWEVDEIQGFPRTIHELTGSDTAATDVDVVIGCDCIYNSYLIKPFVAACAEFCRLREASALHRGERPDPTLLIIAQQLRMADVFESWITEMKKAFKVWRAPEEMFRSIPLLKEGSGFVVHFAVLDRAD